jgi:HEAT repeat protein
VEALVGAIDDETKRIVVEALGEIGEPRSFESVLQALDDDRVDVRVAAVEALGKLADTRGVDPLSTLLETEPDPRLRFTIMLALNRIKGRPDRTVLAAAIRDEDDEVRYLAFQFLVNREGATLEDVATALTSEDRDVRYSAVGKLAGLNGPRAVKLLIRTLQDPDDRVRRVAVRALARLGDVRAVEPLIAVLREEADEGFRHEDIRDAVAQALRELTGRDFGHLHAEWSAWWRQHKRSFT